MGGFKTIKKLFFMGYFKMKLFYKKILGLIKISIINYFIEKNAVAYR